MINRIVPMISPFLHYVRRRERLLTLRLRRAWRYRIQHIGRLASASANCLRVRARRLVILYCGSLSWLRDTSSIRLFRLPATASGHVPDWCCGVTPSLRRHLQCLGHRHLSCICPAPRRKEGLTARVSRQLVKSRSETKSEPKVAGGGISFVKHPLRQLLPQLRSQRHQRSATFELAHQTVRRCCH